MKKLSLQVRITMISALILITIAVILTIIAVENAQTTYTNQFELNLGEDFSIRYNDDELSINSNGEDLLGGIFGFINQLNGNQKETEAKIKAEGIFSEAGKEFTQKSLWVMVVFTILGVIITYFFVRRALAPVRNLSQKVKEINENNLYQKMEEPATKDEIGSLTCSFNDMLDRLDMSFSMQKNFAANAAHELRTPLSTMKAGIQVLEMDEEPMINDYKETIDVIKKNTERMIKVVDDLLGLTRNEQCDFTNYVDLSKVFPEIKYELTNKADAKKVNIILEKCEGYVKGNETLIYRALFNLVENGVKYNRISGSVIIKSEAIGTGVRITISDNGIGIPQEALKHIFEPFYRVDKSRSKTVSGSGLGLAIVKDIIDKHKGVLSVTSTEGVGTMFVIEFN